MRMEPKTCMDQRTVNVIMCCKGHNALPGATGDRLHDIAVYMANECGCPIEDYKGRLMESILEEAMFDYMNYADRPGADLRNLFHVVAIGEPTLCERICSMFSLVSVKGGDRAEEYVNGFSEELLRKSDEDLGVAPESGGATG